MSERDSLQSLLALRKLTRAIADTVRTQLAESLAVLAPLLKPTYVLGEFVQGGQREPNRKAERAFKELQSLYDRIATAPPFNLPKDIKPPFNLGPGTLEITPVEYAHVASAGGEKRTITVRSPLTWTLTYTDFPLSRLTDQLSSKLRSIDETQKLVLSCIAMHVVTSQQTGLMQMLESLHLPVSSVKVPGFADLPVTRIGLGVKTTRPSDEVIIESAELMGMDDLTNLHDPLKDRLLALARDRVRDGVSG
jgi:hypothetical protein